MRCRPSTKVYMRTIIVEIMTNIFENWTKICQFWTKVFGLRPKTLRLQPISMTFGQISIPTYGLDHILRDLKQNFSYFDRNHRDFKRYFEDFN